MFRNDRLKSLRERDGYTHQELASKLDVGFAQIYRWEAGKASPGSEVLGRMAETFKVSVDYLMGLTDDLTPYVKVDNLSDEEKAVVAALRRGDRMEAVQIISGH